MQPRMRELTEDSIFKAIADNYKILVFYRDLHKEVERICSTATQESLHYTIRIVELMPNDSEHLHLYINVPHSPLFITRKDLKTHLDKMFEAYSETYVVYGYIYTYKLDRHTSLIVECYQS